MIKTYCLAASLLIASSAFAQELGLDLSEPEVPLEYRPSVAFIGVTSAEDDEASASRARLLETELLKTLTGNASFSRLVSPAEVARAAPAARTCTDYACLEGVAAALDVHRLVIATVTRSGPASVLAVVGFDGTLPVLIGSKVESGEKQEKQQLGGFAGIAGKSQAQRDREFVKKALPVFSEVVSKLVTPLGKMSVDSIDASAVATIKGKEIGVGRFEKVLPTGTYELTVVAEGYKPYEQQVKIESQQVFTVKVLLIAKPVEFKPVAVVEKPDDGTRKVYQRPGLYVALAGAIAAGVGVAFGQSAKATEAHAQTVDANGITPVTRADAEAAKTQALLANVLVGAGAAAVVGGGVWFFITPSPAAPMAPSSGEPNSGAGFGVMVGGGGTF